MPVVAASQTKREFCIALLNRRLHKNNICPGNHNVGYFNGWFNIDDEQFRDPDLTAEADKIMKAGTHRVLYSEVWNTYVLDGMPQECDHNDMIENDEPGSAWKCAKCGYVYGKDD